MNSSDSSAIENEDREEKGQYCNTSFATESDLKRLKAKNSNQNTTSLFINLVPYKRVQSFPDGTLSTCMFSNQGNKDSLLENVYGAKKLQ